ncbi:lipopolysaccharide-responsive and beige-like anchor protein isoform X2 [Oscarella lobularis]|uniref:lipopolysaccharide-responsive and beige-like anchor protein isoform X2 n=1 Tax=Oscarella lobularis TaxID=121494 RepID=UPI0033144EA5
MSRSRSGVGSNLLKLLLRVEGDQIDLDAIEALLSVLVGGRFDIQRQYYIRDGNALQLLLDALDARRCTTNVRAQTWSIVGELLAKSTHNVREAIQFGLTMKALNRLETTTDAATADKITRVLSTLISNGMSVKELKAFIACLKGRNRKYWPSHAHKLLSALKDVPANQSPDGYFHFRGDIGAAIALPPLARWPSQSGFTVSLWVRREPNPAADVATSRPVLYWFRTGKGLGYSAHFSGFTLILESANKTSKKPQYHQVEKQLLPYQWYMITIVYSYHRLRASEAACYVDGKYASSGEMSFVSTKEPFDKCFLGTSPGATLSDTFSGQMSTFYLFQEALPSTTVAAMYKLGPSYRSQYRYESEADCFLDDSERRALYDGRLSASIVFTYNAKACDGQLCLESSPTENPSFFVHSPHATRLEGVVPVVTQSFFSALHSAGGIQILFPLFSQLDYLHPLAHHPDGGVPEYSTCATLLSLLCDLLSESVTRQRQMVQSHGFLVISFLIQKASPRHLTEEVLDILLGFSRTLLEKTSRTALLHDLLNHVFFNPELWIHTEARVQLKLLSSLATEFVALPSQNRRTVDIRRDIGVPRLVLMLKQYYWTRMPLDGAKGVGIRPSTTDLVSLRSFLLLIVKQLVSRGIVEEELNSLLAFLNAEREAENLSDVLQLVIALAAEVSDSFIPLFDRLNGIRTVFALLDNPDGEIRVYALKLMGIFLHQVNQKRAMEIVESRALFHFVAKRLVQHDDCLSVPLYNTLYELMVNQVSKQILSSRHAEPGPETIIYWPNIIPVVGQLLNWSSGALKEESGLSSPTLSDESGVGDVDAQESMQRQKRRRYDVLRRVRLNLLTDLALLMNNNPANCRVLLAEYGWQHWLVEIGSKQADASRRAREQLDAVDNDVTELAFSLFRTLLCFSMRHEKEGWRAWAETVSVLNVLLVDKELQNRVEIEMSKSAISSPTGGGGTVLSVRIPVRSASDSGVPVGGELESAVDSKAGEFGERKKSGGGSRLSLGGGASSSYRFKWSDLHCRLLTAMMDYILGDLESWKKEPGRSVTEFATDKENVVYISNVTHFLSLTADHLIVAAGGIDDLIQRATGGEADRSLTGEEFMPLIRKLTDLAYLLVLDTMLSFSNVETARKMSTGGMLRQGLRLVFTVAAWASAKSLEQNDLSSTSFQDEKKQLQQLEAQCAEAGANPVDAVKPLVQFIIVALKRRQSSLLGVQSALTAPHVTRLKAALGRDTDDSQLSQHVALAIIHFVCELVVARYSRIVLPPSSPSLSSPSPAKELLVRRLVEQQMASSGSPRLLRRPRSSSLRRTASSDDKDKDKDKDVGRRSPSISAVASPTGGAARPMPSPSSSSHVALKPIDVSEQVDAMLVDLKPLLAHVFATYKGPLTKRLRGSQDQELMNKAFYSLLSSGSSVELVMLLSSQEWQNALKVHAGMAFVELVKEGLKIQSSVEAWFLQMGQRLQTLLAKEQGDITSKHAEFEEMCASSVREYTSLQSELVRSFQAAQQRYRSQASQTWTKVSDILMNRHGAWGSSSDDDTGIQFWKLDEWEDDLRRRMRLVKNSLGTTHPEAVVHPVEGEETDSGSIEAAKAAFRLKMTKALSEELDVLSNADSDDVEGVLDEAEAEREVIFAGRVVLSCSCRILCPCVVLPGTLTITTSALYFASDEESDDYKKLDPQLLQYTKSLNAEWFLDDVKAILSRRYMTRPCALEIFFREQEAAMFAFEDAKTLKKVARVLPRVGGGSLYGLPATRAISLASAKEVFRKSNMTLRWQHGEISNFEYLIFLNTVAGRTYNDLNQYPVFPWVISNYEATELDLTDSRNFRDLSMPIGCLNERRFAVFEERYESWEDDSIPPFHYGTHYSNMAFTLSWLIRLEPFATQFLQLQGGKFDQPGRTFSSLSRAWKNCLNDTSDVKELIPELFYLPEMLENTGQFVFGVDEDGHVVNDVVLPPWASSPEEFVRIHRDALESDYVSSHLHEWIDLIFGYRQRGEAAIQANNVFYYLTYEGSVDLDAIEDPIIRKAVEDQIRNFGQTPSQLLTQPHPRRLTVELEKSSGSLLSSSGSKIVARLAVTRDVPVAMVRCLTGPYAPSPVVTTVSCNQAFANNAWKVTGSSDSRFPSAVSFERDSLLGGGTSQRRLGEPLDQSLTPSAACFAPTGDHRHILACGYWDNSFKCFAFDTGRLIQSVFGHRAVVSCLAYSPRYGPPGTPAAVSGDGVVATGSRDTTVLVWRWSASSQRIAADDGDDGNATPRAILTGHEHPIVCVAVSGTHGLVASGSQGGICLLHATSGDLLRSLTTPTGLTRPHLAAFGCDGQVVFQYSDGSGYVGVFSCNGKLLVHRSVDEQLLAIIVSADGRHVLSGGFGKRVVVRRLHDLQPVKILCACESSIRALDLTTDESHAIVGLSTGEIVAIPIRLD